jgi:hypothetical protein
MPDGFQITLHFYAFWYAIEEVPTQFRKIEFLNLSIAALRCNQQSPQLPFVEIMRNTLIA